MEGYKSLYKPLRKSVRQQATRSGFKLPKQPVDFVGTFLRRVVPSSKLAEEEQKLKYRTQPLDQFKSKRRKAFNKNPGKRKKLTAKEKRDLNLFKLNKKDVYEYGDYEPMHSLWIDYINDLIGLHSITDRNLAQVTGKLLKADYHGSILCVQRSKCPSYVGTSGIVIQETRNMFTMVTKDNKLKDIPKANSVFTFDILDHTFKMYGNQFQVNASDRVRKRFKLKATVDL